VTPDAGDGEAGHLFEQPPHHLLAFLQASEIY
jgi:hypothetical protein